MFRLESSLSRAASTAPAEPPPTMMTSAVSIGFDIDFSLLLCEGWFLVSEAGQARVFWRGFVLYAPAGAGAIQVSG
jgi:hypothetical protein